MTARQWDARMLTSTRGQILLLLRRNARTVEELAQALDLTDNAVRVHLAALERDGLAQQRGVRRSGCSGKPAYEYVLTAEAEHIFPRPYAQALRELLDILSARMPAEALTTAAREVGHRMALQLPAAAKTDAHSRAEAVTRTLNALGGLAELELRDGRYIITGYSCPLAAAVPGHPEICALTETLVSDVAGTPVCAQCVCEGEQQPRCHFEIACDASADTRAETPAL